MIPRGVTLWKIVWIVHVFCEGYICAEALLNRTDQRIENRTVDTVSGVKLSMNQTNASISSKEHATLKGNEIQVKHADDGNKNGDSETNKRQPLRRIGSFIMMLPFAMQLLSLPGAIASIKMSLLRSIFVAKLAIVILLINVLLNAKKSEVVVVHQAQNHQHHYYEYPHPQEEDNSAWSWWGR